MPFRGRETKVEKIVCFPVYEFVWLGFWRNCCRDRDVIRSNYRKQDNLHPWKFQFPKGNDPPLAGSVSYLNRPVVKFGCFMFSLLVVQKQCLIGLCFDMEMHVYVYGDIRGMIRSKNQPNHRGINKCQSLTNSSNHP